MTTPQDSPQVFEGIDIEVDVDEVKRGDAPAAATSEESGDGAMGGTGGENAGGAG